MNYTYEPDPKLSAEFVPLVCGYPGRAQFSPAKLASTRDFLIAHRRDYPNRTIFLVGNEIGHFGGTENDGRLPDQYAADFHDCYAMLKDVNPTFQVSVGPAILSKDYYATQGQIAGTGLAYLRQVIDSYREQYGHVIPAEYFAATSHVVPEGGIRSSSLLHHVLDVETYKEQVRDLRTVIAEAGLQDRSVIITELGDPFRGGSPQHIAEFMVGAVTFLANATDAETGCPSDSNHLVQRWGWFFGQAPTFLDKLRRLGPMGFLLNVSQTSLFDQHGRPTYLGLTYAQLTAAPLATANNPATQQQQ